MPIAALWPLPAQPLPAARPVALVSPPLAASDFLGALQLYLPQGRAWRAKDDPESVMYQFLAAFAEEQFDAYQRETNIFGEISPATTFELIPEWEASLGLPDPCLPEGASTAMVQAQILTRFQAPGGQSIPYFVNYAAGLGAAVTITEMSNGRVNETACCEAWGTPSPAIGVFTDGWVDETTCCQPWNTLSWLYPPTDWDYTLLVTVTQPYTYEWAVGDSTVNDPLTDFGTDPATAIEEFAVGDGTCCTPLAQWGESVVECELRRILPAQCSVIFAYAA